MIAQRNDCAEEPGTAMTGFDQPLHGRRQVATLTVMAGALAVSMSLWLMVLPVTAQRASNDATGGPESGGRDRDAVARRLEEGKRKLTSTERRALSLKSDVASLREEQARINQRLIDAGRLAQSSELRMSNIESRIGELGAQEKLIRGSLAQRHGQMSKLFAAMQRMGRNPPPVIVTRREDALKMVRSAMLLARAFPELKARAEELSTRLNDLVRVMTEMREESAKLRSETAKLNEARTHLAALMESKRQSLGDRQKELSELRRAALDISSSVSDLSELMRRLDREVEKRTELGDYNRALADAQAATAGRGARPDAGLPASPPTVRPAEPGPGPGAGPGPVPPSRAPIGDPSGPGNGGSAKPSEAPANRGSSGTGGTAVAAKTQQRDAGSKAQTAAEPKAKSTVVASLPGPQVALVPRGPFAQNPGRMKPAIPFDKAKGQLPMPAQGKLLIRFGDKTQLGSSSMGIVIATRAGATVVSPSDGWVVYAGAFRSYGQVLIINAGGGYHILLANLARIDADVGRFVLAGEPVGTMESRLSAKGRDNAPVLYVEFRNKQGKPIDPSSWWAEGSRKVQG